LKGWEYNIALPKICQTQNESMQSRNCNKKEVERKLLSELLGFAEQLVFLSVLPLFFKFFQSIDLKKNKGYQKSNIVL